MTRFARYGIYWMPKAGSALDTFGAAWFGRDAQAIPRARLVVEGLDPAQVAEITATPQRYGFHGTLKPPFRLAEGTDQGGLEDAIASFAHGRAAFGIGKLELRRLGGFLALVPGGPQPDLSRLAADVVTRLDGFRAPPAQAELDRRRANGLTARQEALLGQWGYPFVMDEFRFHLTLTGRLEGDRLDRTQAALESVVATAIADPVHIDQICLVGEREDGVFQLLQRFPLS